MLKMTVTLCLIATAAGFAIAVTNFNTREKIEQQEQLKQKRALEAVLPAGSEIVEKNGTAPLPPTYWEARQGGSVVAYAFEVGKRGYSSEIRMMAGVDRSGEILGLKILSQNETPGLGTRVQEVASKNYIWNGFPEAHQEQKAWFTEQFEGIDTREDITIEKSGEWHALSGQERERLVSENTITAITGATISTTAVTAALQQTVASYLTHLGE
jgi:electron transport complex protein RnfG